MYHVSIPMALMDFVPVLFFGAAALLLQKDLYNKMSRTAFSCFAAGTIDVFFAGFLKALWKLLYAANICDFEILNHMMMPLQSIGFLLAGAGLILMLSSRKSAALMAAPPVFGGSLVFIALMSIGLGILCTALSIVAVKMKKKLAMVLFISAFLCSMGMGALAGQDMTLPWVNWTEQAINCVGQGLLLGGTLVLHKAGLKDFKL